MSSGKTPLSYRYAEVCVACYTAFEVIDNSLHGYGVALATFSGTVANGASAPWRANFVKMLDDPIVKCFCAYVADMLGGLGVHSHLYERGWTALDEFGATLELRRKVDKRKR